MDEKFPNICKGSLTADHYFIDRKCEYCGYIKPLTYKERWEALKQWLMKDYESLGSYVLRKMEELEKT